MTQGGTSTMPSAQELIAGIEQAGEEYARFIETQSEEAFHRRPAEEEWTAAELTGHVAEFPATFAEQARRLAESPGLKIGRMLDDPGRLAAVARLAGAGPADAARAVRATVHQAVSTLRGIPGSAWDVRGQHPRYGDMSLAYLVEHFVLDHLRDHLKQAQAAVGAN
ncbi:MAG TPA: DinB family protein [Chloroflexota bacterium]|nr:DinB family protein [Chloroflexota bacterium]